MNFQGNCYPPGLGKLFKFTSLKANIICFNLLCASRIVSVFLVYGKADEIKKSLMVLTGPNKTTFYPRYSIEPFE